MLNYEKEPEVLIDTLQLKYQILKQPYFYPYLLDYERQLIQCYFDYNKPIEPINVSNIQVSTLTEEGAKQYKCVMMSDKNCKNFNNLDFTIGNVGWQKFSTSNPLIPQVRMEINEVEFNDCKIEFMHLEVNYENYFVQKNKNQHLDFIHNELQELASQKTKQQIWSFVEKKCKLQIRSLRKTLDYPLIFISQESSYSSLVAGGTYQIGTYARIEISSLSNTLKELLQESEGQNILSVLYFGFKKSKQAKFLGIPSQIAEIFSKISVLQYDQFCQEYQALNPVTQKIIANILQKQVLRVKVSRQLNQSDSHWYIIAFEKSQFEFGRRNENDLIIKHSHVNGHHGRIIYCPNLNRWQIIDCNSRFGTWRVIKDNKYHKIDNNQILMVGSIKIQLTVQLCEEHLSLNHPWTTTSIVEDILKM